LSTVTDQERLLLAAVRWHDVWTAADCERAVLVAVLEESGARCAAEIARKEAHDSAILAKLNDAASVGRTLTVTGLGTVSEGLGDMVEAAESAVRVARKQLADFDTATQELHATYLNENR
jgi:hypothetical protein